MLKIRSDAFKDGRKIPEKYTGEGDDVSPALSWSGAPNGTVEFALICDDPDAPTADPWVHWVCWGIPGTAQNLIAATKRKRVGRLTVVSHNFFPMIGFTEEEVMTPTALLPQLAKLITTVVGVRQLGAGEFVKEYIEQGLEVELSTHGTLASRLYAGAAGLGGFCRAH